MDLPKSPEGSASTVRSLLAFDTALIRTLDDKFVDRAIKNRNVSNVYREESAMFLRNCWYVAGWTHHFPEDGLVTRTILGDPIVLYRKRDGGIVALENRCCHRLAPLSRGRKEGDDLRCMYHGLKFAPSGKCIEVPQQDIIPSTALVRSYPVVEQDCWVWIWMGEPALADRALIPGALNH